MKPRKVPLQMSLTESEYTALRHTIASRGTARMTLLPVTVIGWALVAGTLTVIGGTPAASLFSLMVLAGGFEAIHAMHVGVDHHARDVEGIPQNHVGGLPPDAGEDDQFL